MPWTSLPSADNARSLGWLPRELPPHVHLVVSTLPGECLNNLAGKVPLENFLELKPMPAGEGEAVLDGWLREAGRRLQPEQKETIMAGFRACGLPLYLKLAFEEARLWKSYDPAPTLSPDIQGMIRGLFSRLSADSNHGAVLVSRSLAYLAAAKNGLSEDELLDVLSLDGEVITDFYRRSPKSPRVDRLPPVIWSRLYFDLEPYLAERSADGTSLLSFYHAQVSAVIFQEFLQEKEKHHHLLAEYFTAQPLAYTLGGVEKPNLRKLSELPWQQFHAGEGMGLIQTVTNFRFMEGKLAAFGPFSLMEDYKLTEGILEVIPDDILESVALIKRVSPTVPAGAHQGCRPARASPDRQVEGLRFHPGKRPNEAGVWQG